MILVGWLIAKVFKDHIYRNVTAALCILTFLFYHFLGNAAKTKSLLFNGAKAVMGKIWTGDEIQPTGPAEIPACSQTLLRGQRLIGHDGKLTKANVTQGESFK